jgi:hypothetical protein
MKKAIGYENILKKRQMEDNVLLKELVILIK